MPESRSVRRRVVTAFAALAIVSALLAPLLAPSGRPAAPSPAPAPDPLPAPPPGAERPVFRLREGTKTAFPGPPEPPLSLESGGDSYILMPRGGPSDAR